MCAGRNFVGSSCRDPGVTKHVVYMDDRTWVAESPQTLVSALDWWLHFSRVIGLRENPDKTQLVVHNEHSNRELRAYLAEHDPALIDKVTFTGVVLGAVTQPARARVLHAKEL